MANEIQITSVFPPSRERAVLLELLAVTQALKKEGIDAVVCGGWVPFLKELARDSQSSHSMSFDIDIILRAKAREREAVDRVKALLSKSLAYQLSRMTTRVLPPSQRKAFSCSSVQMRELERNVRKRTALRLRPSVIWKEL